MAEVLVVEDEQSLLHTLRYNLSRAGHAVRLCTDGGRALEMVRENPPDLMLLDLMLPGMDGLEVCRTLRRDVHVRWLRGKIEPRPAEPQRIETVRGVGYTFTS